MAKSTRKKKQKARGKSRKNTSARDLQNRSRGAQPNTKQKAPTEAAPRAQGVHPIEKEPENQVKPPFIVRTQVKFIFSVGSVLTGVALGWLWGRSVAHTHGVEGAVKVASVTILPLIAFMCVVEITKRGFMRARALGRTVRTNVISLGLAVLIVLPFFWRKIGYQEICWHVFLGGVIGYAIAFLSWLYLAAKRHPWLIQRQYGQWVWVYRFSASVLILVGGWIGVFVR
jgi:hypothetical protein